MSDCDPMDCTTSDLPINHQLLEFTQTHVDWVSDTVQSSHPLSSPSLPALNLSPIRVFSNESALCSDTTLGQIADVLEMVSLQHSNFYWSKSFLLCTFHPDFNFLWLPKSLRWHYPMQFSLINTLNLTYLSVFILQFSHSVIYDCDIMDCSTPGCPVNHQLLEFTQTHVHWVSDNI